MEAGANRPEITATTGEVLERLMIEDQDKKKERKRSSARKR
ncbi:hypothetical protein SynBIOSE41_01116 [Synechococcus sp. BIOS-E4-1]|nr:hypothetical protein SynBIOSE41_01116 [Synechococcus sp. BIOS-E4-1]